MINPSIKRIEDLGLVWYAGAMTNPEKYFNRGRGKDLRKKGRKRTWQVENIWDLHHAIKRRVFLGQKNKEIAEALGCCPQTVSNVRNSPVIEEELAIMHGAADADSIDLAQEIRKIAPESLKLIKNVITGKEESASIALRVKAAESNLDRAGFAPPKVVKTDNIHTFLTTDEIASIKEQALKKAKESNDIVDAEVIENPENLPQVAEGR